MSKGVAKQVADLAASLTLPESGRHNMVPGEVGIRDYPFPYRCAFTAILGVGNMNADRLRQVAQAAAPTGDSPLEAALPVGGSFTYDLHTDRLSLGSGGQGDDESLIVELAVAGNVCVVRDIPEGDIASRAADRMARLGLTAPVAVNASASLPGVLFRSDDTLIERHKFGDNLDYRIKPDFRNILHAYRWEAWTSDLDSDRDLAISRFNRTLQTDDPVNGVTAFKRYSGNMDATASTMPVLVNAYDLDWLSYWRGTLVFDFEPAMSSIIGRRPGQGCLQAIEGPIIDSYASHCWADVSGRHAAQELLVMTPADLLLWLSARSALKLDLEKQGDGLRATIQISTDNVAARSFARAGYPGLAVVVPSGIEDFAVIDGLTGEQLELARCKDGTMRDMDCLHSPWSASDRLWRAAE